MTRLFSSLGAIFYALWALLHLYAAYGIYALAMAQQASLLRGR